MDFKLTKKNKAVEIKAAGVRVVIVAVMLQVQPSRAYGCCTEKPARLPRTATPSGKVLCTVPLEEQAQTGNILAEMSQADYFVINSL